MALSADILRGYTDTIILHQLSHGDSYGYQTVSYTHLTLPTKRIV